MAYFTSRDITNFNPTKFPLTEAREDIITAGLSYLDSFIRDNCTLFSYGIPCQTVLEMKHQDPELSKMKTRNFELQLKDKYDRVRRTVDKRITYNYVRRDDCKRSLKPKEQLVRED
jgi:hypothetical protein